jgi:hypothetical protein
MDLKHINDPPRGVKCKLTRCGEPALARNILCKKHWILVPWGLRRHVSRLLRKNDFMTHGAYDECMQIAYGLVTKAIKESQKPPTPELPWTNQ